MDLTARLKRMWRGHEEKLAEKTVEAQSAAPGDDLELTPGLDREIEQRAAAEEFAAEHEEPE